MSRGTPGGRRKPAKPKAGGGPRPAGPGPARAGSPETPQAGRPGGAKAAREEAARRARRRERLRRRSLFALMVLLAAGVVVVSLASAAADRRDEQRLRSVLTAGSCTVDSRTDSGRDHIDNPSYKVDPPAGGDHTPQAASPGVYPPGQVPEDGLLVHAMEHGFVILWYRPGVDDQTVGALEEVAGRDPEATLVVPRESMDVPVAATAWHRRLLCPGGFEEKPLVEFIKAYRDEGPEKGFVQ